MTSLSVPGISEHLSDTNKRSKFIGGRLRNFLQPFVEEVLEIIIETYDTG